MTVRKVSINREKCDGCGLCVTACHEGAIELVDGKAALVQESLCDGLGDCLPACPRNAISFSSGPASSVPDLMATPGFQWPIQIGLVSPSAGFLRGRLVIAADCTAFTADDFKRRFVRGDPLVIGCPKLDDRARFDKIYDILRENEISEIEVVRIEVPCCKALASIVSSAVAGCGKDIPVRETVISRSGSVI